MKFHQCLHFQNPKSFNEKMQWLKLNDKDKQKIKRVDKYEVRNEVARMLGSEVLVKLLGVYDSFDAIDFRALPERFVLKCTHDSGGVVICKNKAALDIPKTKQRINECMKRNYFWVGREWPYRFVRPRIIVEEYLENCEYGELRDYKIFCFNGIAKIIQIDYDRFTAHKRAMYDIEWNRLPFTTAYPTEYGKQFPKPKRLSTMLEYAEMIAQGERFVRVDFFVVEEKIYFGEITYYHGNGLERFSPGEWDAVLGSWIDLDDKGSKGR